ncbi:MAG TPA: 1-acyl-sn-glycerol-3-phosphate acyltransferase [Microlunatus sp.]|nr:1-acyl-sn-glycerol-3-phosphate acyltransferase [Microlunatus sp.]
MAEAEIIQLGSRGKAGRGSGKAPSAAARGLAPGGKARSSRARATPRTTTASEDVADASPASAPLIEPDVIADPVAAEVVEPIVDAEIVDEPVTAPETGDGEPVDPAGAEDTIADDFGTPDIDDASWAAAGEHGASGERPDPATGSTGGHSGQVPPVVNLAAMVTEFAGALTAALGNLRSLPVEQLRDLGRDPLKAVLQLAETLGVDWQESVEDVVAFTRSRMSGQYAIDEFGFDPEFTTKVFLPILRPLAQNWFRVEVRGIENLPTTGSALLVSNHAGTMPLDGMVLQSVVYDEIGRHVRMLGADLIFKTPYSHDFARRTGTTLACQEDAERLLASDQLVAVFPEGFKGLGKPYADRYKLQRFGRGGFVSAAVRAQVPLIPVSIVGSEEIYPLIASAPTLARAMGAPYFPITPLFPWFGVLGLIPLPSKWIIQFGEAITTDELSPGAAEDPMVVFNVTDQVRETIQHSLYALLMQRRSAFF